MGQLTRVSAPLAGSARGDRANWSGTSVSRGRDWAGRRRRVAVRRWVAGDEIFRASSSLHYPSDPGGGEAVRCQELVAVEQTGSFQCK